MSSLEEAFWSMFVEEELFEGNNLYRCAQCDRLVTAAKVSGGGTDMATHVNDAYTILAIQVVHLPSMLFVFSLPNSGNSLRS